MIIVCGLTLKPRPKHVIDFKIALQVVVLIERAARKNIQVRDKGLDDFMPNRKDYRRPKAEYLLQKFEHVVSGTLRLADGNDYGFVSELTELQSDILKFSMCPVTATPTRISLIVHSNSKMNGQQAHF